MFADSVSSLGVLGAPALSEARGTSGSGCTKRLPLCHGLTTSGGDAKEEDCGGCIVYANKDNLSLVHGDPPAGAALGLLLIELMKRSELSCCRCQLAAHVRSRARRTRQSIDGLNPPRQAGCVAPHGGLYKLRRDVEPR